ncbi:hypothetical protein RvY_15974 [Ramazzottius varieornatus]|uniref:Uncharacterized protein n=1 Tax=Ramazzottius varieornatus TaxID=947166 RepID=A0A1D1W1D6_RAMVA|nr:hypothetical protein RvY_15974 [Ramazzottius varieornatus]
MTARHGREACPETIEEDGRRMPTRTTNRQARRTKSPSALPGSEGGPQSTKRTLATDSKDLTTQMDQLEHQTGNDEASRT